MVNVLFNGCLGTDWSVGYGERLGGILSGLLFNFYINSMTREINTLPQVWVLAGSKTNFNCYADDIIFLAPSSTGLQFLLNKRVYILQQICETGDFM